MSWTFGARPRPLWFHRESKHPPPRSKLRPPPSVARPSPNRSSGDLKLAEGQIFGQSAKSGGRVATGLLKTSPRPQGPCANMTNIHQHWELLRCRRESYLPSLFMGQNETNHQIHLTQGLKSLLGAPPPACCAFLPPITSTFINGRSSIIG